MGGREAAGQSRGAGREWDAGGSQRGGAGGSVCRRGQGVQGTALRQCWDAGAPLSSLARVLLPRYFG